MNRQTGAAVAFEAYLPATLPEGGMLVLLGVLVAVTLWLCWRQPTLVFLIALASIALRPQLLWGGPRVSWEWGLHQTLIVLALLVNAMRYGVRLQINWPIAAMLVVLVLASTLGDAHPKLDWLLILESVVMLALPFSFTQVVLEPGSRRKFSTVIVLLPFFSVLLGGILHLAEIQYVFSYEAWMGEHYRLPGAAGQAAVFATLAFAGFVVAVHESTRPRRPFAAQFAVVNLILVILSGTRMAIFASVVFLAGYAAVSATFREQLQRHRAKLLLGVALVVGTLVLYASTLQNRMFGTEGEEIIRMSGRDNIWPFFYDEFLLSPLFGRGFGSGFVAATPWFGWQLPTPHNEYLHLLVVGGAVGFVVCMLAIILWYRQLMATVSLNDRDFLVALCPALLAYACTDNILFYTSALPLYTYFGVLMTRPAPPWVDRPVDVEGIPLQPDPPADAVSGTARVR